MYLVIIHFYIICYLFLALWADEHNHSFTFEIGHIVGFAVFLEISGETREQEFALLFEDDRASAEEDIRLHFVTFLKELLGVLELEVVVVIIGLRAETDLLHLLLLLVRLRFLLLLFLRIEELLVVNHPAYRRIRRRSYLDQVEVLFVGYTHSLLERVDALLYIVADEANLGHTFDLVIDTVRILFDDATATRSARDCCYSFFLLIRVNN